MSDSILHVDGVRSQRTGNGWIVDGRRMLVTDGVGGWQCVRNIGEKALFYDAE